jgi:sigma-B regulation protein RsbU (phosphoserine phosphatase)
MNTKPTILIVDDEESHRYTMRLILQHAGFQVSEAATGDEALRLVDEHPDVVILDLHLPDVAGIEICRILKTTPRTATIPVLHVTAVYPGSAERAEALAAGADGYVTRPLEAAQLLATIKALLARRAA